MKTTYTNLFQSFCQANALQITHDPAKRRNAGFAYLPYEKPVDAEDDRENAWHMIKKIIELNNKEKGFIPDPSSRTQLRWFPVGEWTGKGLVFSDTDFEFWSSYSYAVVGAPFVSPTSSEAKRIFLEFIPIYEKLWR